MRHAESWVVLFDWRFITALARVLQRSHGEPGGELTNLIKAEIFPAERDLSTTHRHKHYVDKRLLVEDVNISAFSETLSNFDIEGLQVFIVEPGRLDLIGRNVDISEVERCLGAAEMYGLDPVEQGQLLQLDLVFVDSNLLFLDCTFENLNN